MVLRYHARRMAALLLGAGAALLVTALPAAAGTTGTYTPDLNQRGDTVKIGGEPTVTTLLGLKLEDGNQLETYCVEIDVTAKKGAALAESPWSEYPDAGEQFNVHPEKVLWILHHSYPNVDLDTLSKAVGVTLDKEEAIAGTQAAIWHLSNGANLDDDNPADIKALYGYLIGDANVGLDEQPAMSLSITPEQAGEAEAGQSAGPFTVHTTASSVELTVDGPDGVKVVDAEGKALSEVADGTEFWLSAPAGTVPGEATVHATAQAEVQKGRLFVGVDNKEHPTQTLIVASNTETRAKAEASAKWVAKVTETTETTTTTTESSPVTSDTTPSNAFTETPTTTAPPQAQGGSLPNTGAPVLQALGVALVLIGAGVGALLLQRRRTS
jgi:TQXA domain-containing protein